MISESSTAHNDMVTVLPAYILMILSIACNCKQFLTTLFVLGLKWQEFILTGWTLVSGHCWESLVCQNVQLISSRSGLIQTYHVVNKERNICREK